MNDLVHVQQPQSRMLTAAAIREQVNLIQEVMSAVMKENVHYGIIPGCKQPSLYKAGSEVLLTTFRIAVSVVVEDLSSDDLIRYRVRTIGTHQQSGIVVGEGIGECSSNETKYKWRRCYLKQEFEATPETRRRIKYAEGKNGKVYENMEVRTDPADLANTILKMAKKRAQIDMTLTATAASDCFSQDLEDLPEEVVAEFVAQQPKEDTEEQKAAKKKAAHDEALGRNSESIAHIKERIAADDIAAAVAEWRLLSQDDQRALWVAPTKVQGACFTVAEREALRTAAAASQEPAP